MQFSLFDPVEISLDRGCIALIDPIDADLAFLNWRSFPQKSGNVYAVRGGGGRYRLHTIVLERMIGRKLAPGEEADHINLNGLDNRRCNLRLASRNENRRNVAKRKNNKSGFKGVYLDRPGRWRAHIKMNGKVINLGSYPSPEEAHRAYCEAAKKYHGEFARFE